MIDEINKFLAQLRRNPKRALVVGFFVVVLTAGGSFLVKYVETKAEQFATQSKPPTAPDSLNYEIGSERANDQQYDEYIRIYNRSSNDMYIESIELRADMSGGVFHQALVYEPQAPEPLPHGSFKEFRYRLPNKTAADEAAERSTAYAAYTGRSFAYVRTTTGPGLTFETHYHPYFIDRLKLDRVTVVSKKTAVKVD